MNATFHTTRLNMSSKTKSTKECGGKITFAAYMRVQQSTTSRKTKEMLYRTTFV